MKRFLTLFAAVFAMAVSMNAQDTVKKTFDFGDFEGINANFVHHIYITEGKSDKIEVTCPEKYVEYLNYNVTDGVLNFDIDLSKTKRIFNNRDEEIVVKIQMQKIKSISLSGAAELTAEGDFRTDETEIDLSGASKINGTLNLRGTTLEYDLSGTSKCSITGTFTEAKGNISGASEFTFNADVKTLEVEASGTAKCSYTGEADNIDIESSGAANVQLMGKTNYISIECSGAAKADAEQMIAENAKASASGASKIKVYGNEKLELSASAAASIDYYGEAKDVRMTNKSINRGK